MYLILIPYLEAYYKPLIAIELKVIDHNLQIIKSKNKNGTHFELKHKIWTCRKYQLNINYDTWSYNILSLSLPPPSLSLCLSKNNFRPLIYFSKVHQAIPRCVKQTQTYLTAMPNSSSVQLYSSFRANNRTLLSTPLAYISSRGL